MKDRAETVWDSWCRLKYPLTETVAAKRLRHNHSFGSGPNSIVDQKFVEQSLLQVEAQGWEQGYIQATLNSCATLAQNQQLSIARLVLNTSGITRNVAIQAGFSGKYLAPFDVLMREDRQDLYWH